MGKILVIEGTDCSGKTTQYEKLCERLKFENTAFETTSFPNYDSGSSFLLREYLSGKFGTHPSDVNGYTASTFFGVDRYYSYKTLPWGETYRNGGNILLARYTTSNILHQACKLDSEEERLKFIKWLYNFENETLGIPREDEVVLLKMPIKLVKELKKKRGSTSSGGKDIHEEDEEYLQKAYDTALWVAEKLGWTVIDCADENGNIRTIEDIHEDIYKISKKLFE